MKWITEITLNNYRAFGRPETIKIPKGNHLLIYGENGSGKSSIYNGLKDFFSSSVGGASKFKLNKFLKDAGTTLGDVTVGISEIENNNQPIVLKFNAPPTLSTNGEPEMILANKFKGFLDYKRMLKVHATEIPDDVQPNVFNLVIKELLSEHRITNPKGGTTTVELFEEYNRISLILLNNRSDSNDFKAALEELEKLEAIINALLVKVFKKANDYLEKYFKNKISIDLTIGKMEVTKPTSLQRKRMVENLSLKIKYAGTEIEFYQAFLNEARLSSLAICIYLASIKTFDPEADTLKILYLDDVFIGLDNTNRYPLLEIIKEEFIDHNFQVFISTYNREWFELSRHWFETKIPGKTKSLELFIEDDENPNTPDYPVVKPYDGYLAKAKAHFKAKDFPAAGNYLRKECEALIKNYLPNTFKVDSNGALIDELEPLMQKLDELFELSGIAKPKELIDAIKIYRKALLNPSSHSDIKSQLFKKEIEEAFKIAEKLKSLPEIKRTKIFSKGDIFRYENAGRQYSMQIELADHLYLCTYNGAKSLSTHRFRITTWTRDGVEFATNATGSVMPHAQRERICEQFRTVEEIFEGIRREIGIVIPVNLLSEIRIGATGTLNDLLQ
jgi:energy-coupling factor transporter ATP-binding protein EcfA2